MAKLPEAVQTRARTVSVQRGDSWSLVEGDAGAISGSLERELRERFVIFDTEEQPVWRQWLEAEEFTSSRVLVG